MVDLSVVGLLVLHHLAAHWHRPVHLRSATRLMHLCGLLTVALNTAEPLLARHYGRATPGHRRPGTASRLGHRRPHPPPPPPQHLTISAPTTPSQRQPRTRPTGRGSAATAQPGERHRPPAHGPETGTRHGPDRRTPSPPRPANAPDDRRRQPSTSSSAIGQSRRRRARASVSPWSNQALSDSSTPVASSRLTQLMKHLKDEHAPSRRSAAAGTGIGADSPCRTPGYIGLGRVAASRTAADPDVRNSPVDLTSAHPAPPAPSYTAEQRFGQTATRPQP